MSRRVFDPFSPPQHELFPPQASGGETASGDVRPAGSGGPSFVERTPADLFVGGQRLDDYLRAAGDEFPIELRQFLRSLDWTAFCQAYAKAGRAAYAPWAMMGIVLYGVFVGVSSLRGLERLARMDLGCMWAGCGIAPDHSILGRFLVRHQSVLTDEFFEQVTRRILRETGGSVADVAVDGTVIQAAASRVNSLKREAALQAARQAVEEAGSEGFDGEADRLRSVLEGADEVDDDGPDPDPAPPPRSGSEGTGPEGPADDPQLRRAAERRALAVRAGRIADERAAARKSRGADPDSLRVCPTEPEAVVRPLKNGAMAPSYLPSIACNDQRLIVAKDVDPSSEPAVVAGLLDQAERVGDESVTRALADPGYFVSDIVRLALDRDLDLLCPDESAARGRTRRGEPKFPKSQFVYDHDRDSYRCPSGESLTPVERYRGNASNRAYVAYATAACDGCPLLARCTTSERGRRIKRYDDDEAKEALREVMAQPAARQAYQRRMTMVEPPFSVIKDTQGGARFRRRGLAGVKLEFSLHAVAYNLRRWRALGRRAARHALAFWHGLLALTRRFGAQRPPGSEVRRAAVGHWTPHHAAWAA